MLLALSCREAAIAPSDLTDVSCRRCATPRTSARRRACESRDSSSRCGLGFIVSIEFFESGGQSSPWERREPITFGYSGSIEEGHE
jgi:hypothetical protein